MKTKQSLQALSWLQKLKNKFSNEQITSKEDFLQAIKTAEEINIIDSHGRSIIEGAMQVANMEVRDAMVPKSKMIAIEYGTSTKELVSIMIKYYHSRFPVLNSENNKVQGIILAKDLLSFVASSSKQKFNYKEYLRMSILVPESKKLDALLREFQQKKLHMAIVINEYGDIAGLITLEDILEQIVGEIEDEHDLEEEDIIDFGGGRYLLKASTTLEDFNEFFKVKIKSKSFDTVAGLVLSGFTYMPKQMEEITLKGFKFKILKTDSKRLHLLEIQKITKPKNKNV